MESMVKKLLVFIGHKERVRALESHLKRLGEEPHARVQKSSSGSESELEWHSNQENKIKEIEANLQMEREQRQKIEKELLELKFIPVKVDSEVWWNTIIRFISQSYLPCCFMAH